MLNLNDLFLDFNDNLTLKKKYKDLVITGRNALRNKIGSKFEENETEILYARFLCDEYSY